MSMNGNLAYQEDRREELIGGKLVAMAPSPVWGHVSAAGNIYGIFRDHLKGRKCIPIPDGFDLHLTEDDIFIPDMMVVCDRGKIKPDGVYGAPDLVVEVLSPSTAKNDRTYKKDVYGRCGVPEYWLVSPGEKSVEVYRAKGSELVLHDVYTLPPDWMLKRMTDEEKAALVTQFQCHLYDDLTIRLEDIFTDLF